MENRSDLPAEYLALDSAEIEERIAARKRQLGESLCILGHHYQHDEVIRFADFTGDSLKLSQLAAAQRQARYIVFCGVHFMAESADILSGDDQAVCLPSLRAGCTMADMAEDAAVATALAELRALTDAKIVPITYVNSTAAVKAVTARSGGACCTSGNVRNVFAWALAPESDGGLTAADVDRATFLLWKGHCYVHQVFTPEHVHEVRRRHPGITVIVHPECPQEVVQLSDASGSTEQIIRAVAAGKPGSQWAVGTESNLVHRLAARHGDRFVRLLSDGPATCAQMARIDLPHLLWVLDHLAEGQVVNRITVPAVVAADARIALQRMIDIRATPDVTPRKR